MKEDSSEEDSSLEDVRSSSSEGVSRSPIRSRNFCRCLRFQAGMLASSSTGNAKGLSGVVGEVGVSDIFLDGDGRATSTSSCICEEMETPRVTSDSSGSSKGESGGCM